MFVFVFVCWKRNHVSSPISSGVVTNVSKGLGVGVWGAMCFVTFFPFSSCLSRLKRLENGKWRLLVGCLPSGAQESYGVSWSHTQRETGTLMGWNQVGWEEKNGCPHTQREREGEKKRERQSPLSLYRSSSPLQLLRYSYTHKAATATNANGPC